MAKDPGTPLASEIMHPESHQNCLSAVWVLVGDTASPRPLQSLPLSPGQLWPGCRLGFPTSGLWSAGHRVCWPALSSLSFPRETEPCPGPQSCHIPRTAGQVEGSRRGCCCSQSPCGSLSYARHSVPRAALLPPSQASHATCPPPTSLLTLPGL